jgi:hypothetical protein
VTQPTASDRENRKALEALVVDNDDLERLELLIGEFNIFEAIGALRQELRHSSLLAFLLDPCENHSLGDALLRRLLQRALADAPEKAPVAPVDLDVWDMDEVEVRREHANRHPRRGCAEQVGRRHRKQDRQRRAH